MDTLSARDPEPLTYESPLGPLTLTADHAGLRRLEFGGAAAGAARRLPRLCSAGSERPGRHDVGAPDPVGPQLRQAAAQLQAYFAGRLERFDLKLAPAGTAFQQAVWRELERIPYGATTTYGALATRLEHAGSGRRPPPPRAVAAAVARTPVPIVIPCHRVLSADGSLTGYLGGLDRKAALLAFEAGGGSAGQRGQAVDPAEAACRRRRAGL